MYIYMHMHTCIYISPQLVHARLCNGAAASLPWKLLRTYLESCANIVQAVVSAHPPAPSSSRPPSCWPVARHVRLRNPIKSTLAHDAVAAVVLHKHHLIIRVGAGLIQFVYGSHSRLAADLTLDKNLFSLPFSRGFSRDTNWFCCQYRVFCLLSVKVCSWYKTHSKTGNLAGVRYVSILSVPGIQFRPVTVSFEAFSGHKTMMYTLKVLNSLIRDRGSDCNCIINGRDELLVEYILRRLLSKILFFIPVVTVRNVSNNNQSR
jgi:hypothetical protein